MGSKKKMTQMFRREARKTYANTAIELKEKLGVLNQVLKPKPWWVPGIVWRFFSKIFIDVGKLNKVVNDDFLKKIIKYY